MPLQFRLSVLLFLQFFVWSSWLINLGTYMLQTLDFSGRQVGMIYATNAIAATITPPLMGWLADRLFSADRLMVLLNILGGCALIGCFLTTSFLPFYSLMLVYNLCFIPTFSLAASLCFHHLPEPSKQYPGIRVWGTVSFMLMGLLLSYFNVENSPYPLLAGGITSILLGFYCLTLPHTPPSPGFNWATVKGENVQKIFRGRGMVILLLAILACCVPSSFYYSFLNPFLNEVEWPAAAAKMSLGQFLEIWVVLALPWFFRKLRICTIIFCGLLAWGLRYFAFGIGRPDHYEWLLYAGIAVQGIAFAWIIIAAQIYVNNRVPSYLRSTAQGLISFANLGVGAFFGNWIAGEVVNANLIAEGVHDWWAIWLVPGTVGVLAAIFFVSFFPKNEQL